MPAKTRSIRKRQLLAAAMACLLLPGAVARAAVPLSTSPVGAPTIKNFLAGCQHDRGGCGLAIGGVVLDRLNATGANAFAFPATDYADPLVAWLTSHPETAPLTPDQGIFLALKTVYPCA